MKTVVYMVRHADSPKEGSDRTRVLSEKGQNDAYKLMNILSEKEIDVLISSPYVRSVMTLEPLAKKLMKNILVFEDLKENFHHFRTGYLMQN